MKTTLSISMDKRMLDVLKTQACTEGFINVESWVHTVLFRLAVAAKLEDLADPETPEEEAAYTQELREWLINE